LKRLGQRGRRIAPGGERQLKGVACFVPARDECGGWGL
jgi:hypothetical protein